MGDLVSAFDAPPPPSVRGPRSEVDRILSKLDKADQEALRAVLFDTDRWTDRAVAERLTEAGHPCSYWQVRNWRTTHACRDTP